MDKIWLTHNLDLKMTPYKVIGTDCMQGYLEFIADSDTLADMQYKNPFNGKKEVLRTYRDDTIMDFMREKSRKR